MPPLTPAVSRLAAPRFQLIERQFVDPKAVLLAFTAAFTLASLTGSSLDHPSKMHIRFQNSSGGRTPATPASLPQAGDEDDPSQMDTVYLGDPADPPLPTRPRSYVSTVHPFIMVRLPRFGNQLGLIPDTAAGHLLFAWLVAFNQADGPALRRILPMEPLSSAAFEQIELRKKTSGLDVISAAEVRPGVLVFRLQDQTPSAREILGTLQVRPGLVPPAIATFSLRAVGSPGQDADSMKGPTLVALPEHGKPAALGVKPAFGSSRY